jgi:copper chaperone
MIEFNVPAMNCGHCVGAVTKAVRQVDPGAAVEVNLAVKTVKVRSLQAREALAGALSQAGYPPKG